MPEPNVPELLVKLDDAVSRLRTQLVDKIVAQSPTRMPIKVELLRQVLLHRAADLSEAAADLYRENRAVPACVLTRATMETAGILIWLWQKIELVCSSGSLGDTDAFLRRAILGRRSAQQNVNALSALSAVKRVLPVFEHYLTMYDDLSEYAHPNWEGVQGSYSSLDIGADTFHLGTSGHDVPLVTGISYHVICLELALEYSERIVGLLPKFTEIAERELGAGG